MLWALKFVKMTVIKLSVKFVVKLARKVLAYVYECDLIFHLLLPANLTVEDMDACPASKSAMLIISW